MSDPIDQPDQQSELYYKGTPSFKSRKIISTVARGTSGASAPEPAPAVSSSLKNLTPVSTIQQKFTVLEPKFAHVATLLDQRGASLNLCNNAPDNIALRILRRKNDNESCWEFYKRMTSIARQVPPMDPNAQSTFGNQLAGKGNDITLNSLNTIPYPFSTANLPSGDPRANNYNQDPGKDTLLLMLFLAVLQMIVNIIFATALTPIKWVTNGLNSLYSSLTNVPIATPVGPASAAPPAAAGAAQASTSNAKDGGGGLFGPGLLADLLGGVVVLLGNALVKAAVEAGPKLLEDVTRFDSLMITDHIKDMARSSKEANWPEAVLLYPQLIALQEQFAVTNNMFSYFNQNTLQTSPFTKDPLLPSDLADVLGLQVTHSNDILDQMTNVLTGSLVDTAFCCMLKFLASLDTRFLRTLQGILQLEINGLSLRFENLDSILDNLWRSIQTAILSAIMSLMYNLFGEIQNRIKPFFEGLGPSECPPWALLGRNMLQYIGKIENTLLALCMEYNNSLRLHHNYTTIYANALGKSQYLRLLNKLLDILIDSKLAGQLCSSSGIPTDAELTQVFNQFSNLVDVSPTPVTIPIPPGQGTGTGSTTTVVGNSNNRFDDCLKKVSPEEVAQVQAWINKLKGMAP